MTLNHFAQLDRTIANLPNRYPGPGGAVAVVKDGVAIVRHAWGFADLEKRMPYSASTLAPICSISSFWSAVCGGGMKLRRSVLIRRL